MRVTSEKTFNLELTENELRSLKSTCASYYCKMQNIKNEESNMPKAELESLKLAIKLGTYQSNLR